MTITRAGAIVPVLSLGALAPASQTIAPGGLATIQYTLPSAAKVTPIVLSGNTVVARGPQVSQSSGENQASVLLVDEHGSPFVPGVYQIALEATDGIDTVTTDPVALDVVLPSTPAPAIVVPRPHRHGAVWPYAAGIVAGLGVALALAAEVVRRRRRARGEALSRM